MCLVSNVQNFKTIDVCCFIISLQVSGVLWYSTTKTQISCLCGRPAMRLNRGQRKQKVVFVAFYFFVKFYQQLLVIHNSGLHYDIFMQVHTVFWLYSLPATLCSPSPISSLPLTNQPRSLPLSLLLSSSSLFLSFSRRRSLFCAQFEKYEFIITIITVGSCGSRLVYVLNHKQEAERANSKWHKS